MRISSASIVCAAIWMILPATFDVPVGSIAFGDQPQSTAPIQWKKHVVVENVASAINSALASDFDNDGSIDVIASYARGVYVHKGPDWRPIKVCSLTPGRARTKPVAACIHSCLLDVDGDGDQDFIGSNLTLFWLECPDNPMSGEPWTYRTIDDEMLGSHCVLAGDVNLDGQIDLIANSFRDAAQTTVPHSIAWLEVPPNPKHAKHWIRHVFADRDAPGGSHYMGLGDLSGDGRPDISCGAKGDPFENGNWFAWWEQPTDPTQPWTKHGLAVDQRGATNIHPVEIDGDGKMDLIATRGHGSGVIGFKAPTFEVFEIDSEMKRPHSLVTVDLDNDGDIDIATCGSEEDGEAAWYQNDGHGKFQRFDIDSPQSCYDLRAIDMDSDGDLDLLCAGHKHKNIVWYENLR